MTWWGWLLIVLGVVVVIGAVLLGATWLISKMAEKG